MSRRTICVNMKWKCLCCTPHIWKQFHTILNGFAVNFTCWCPGLTVSVKNAKLLYFKFSFRSAEVNCTTFLCKITKQIPLNLKIPILNCMGGNRACLLDWSTIKKWKQLPRFKKFGKSEISEFNILHFLEPFFFHLFFEEVISNWFTNKITWNAVIG